MKKILSLILALIMCLSLCACGGGGKSLSISDGDGKITELSAKELEKIRDTDGRTWSSYENGTISGSGKITKIESVADTGHFYTDLTVVRNGTTYEYQYDEVEIDEDIILLTRRETFTDFYVGDTVSFHGKLVKGSSDIWLLIDCCGENDYDNPELNISLVQE